MIRKNVTETVRIEFEPFINDEARKFIVNGVDYFNIAATGLPDYLLVNFLRRGIRGDLLDGEVMSATTEGNERSREPNATA